MTCIPRLRCALFTCTSATRLLFQKREEVRGPFHDVSWKACKGSHLYAVGIIAGPISNGVKKPQLSIAVRHLDVNITQPFDFILKTNQLMIVRGEERPGTDA